jgi:hypothetical protein
MKSDYPTEANPSITACPNAGETADASLDVGHSLTLSLVEVVDLAG